MVHENHVHVIVMVTNEVEGDRLKCHRYWPSAEEGQVRQTGTSERSVTGPRRIARLTAIPAFPSPKVTHGELTIELTNEIVHATFVERHLTATPTDGGQVSVRRPGSAPAPLPLPLSLLLTSTSQAGASQFPTHPPAPLYPHPTPRPNSPRKWCSLHTPRGPTTVFRQRPLRCSTSAASSGTCTRASTRAPC